MSAMVSRSPPLVEERNWATKHPWLKVNGNVAAILVSGEFTTTNLRF